MSKIYWTKIICRLYIFIYCRPDLLILLNADQLYQYYFRLLYGWVVDVEYNLISAILTRVYLAANKIRIGLLSANWGPGMWSWSCWESDDFWG